MKESLFTVFITVILLITFAIKVDAYDFKVDGIYYNIISATEMTAEVTNEDGNSGRCYTGDVVIPNTVIYKEKIFKITKIGYRAFYGCYISSINIPYGVTHIDDLAFLDSYFLTSINLPKSVTHIGKLAFQDCIRLTSMDIPESVISIGDAAFFGCSGLTQVKIPNSVTIIGEYVFYGCSSLESLSIPNSIKEIPDRFCDGCSRLINIDIPDGIITIKREAFENCSNLKSVTIPQSVKTIYGGAFLGCSNLSEIKCFAKEPPVLYSKNLYLEIDYGQIFTEKQFLLSTLYVPKESLKAYRDSESWGNFVTIKEDGAFDNVSPCEKPVISYSDKKLVFTSNTKGAEYHYTLTANDVKNSNTYSNGIVNIEACYNIRAYATADGYLQSEITEATLYFLDGNIITSSDVICTNKRGVVLSSNQGFISVSGLDNNESVMFYDVAGKLLGKAKSVQGIAQCAVGNKNEIVIVKIGDTSLKVNVK